MAFGIAGKTAPAALSCSVHLILLAAIGTIQAIPSLACLAWLVRAWVWYELRSLLQR
jgi:hypothetical protein